MQNSIVLFTFSVFDLQVLSKKSLWHFDITWSISQEFTWDFFTWEISQRLEANGFSYFLFKLYQFFTWIYRFRNNVKNKIMKSDICLNPLITSVEQTFSDLFYQNQNLFSDAGLKTLSKDLRLDTVTGWNTLLYRMIPKPRILLSITYVSW